MYKFKNHVGEANPMIKHLDKRAIKKRIDHNTIFIPYYSDVEDQIFK